VVDAFRREELAVGDSPAPADAEGLLLWAQSLAESAQADDIYRSKEGRKTLRFLRGGRSYFLKLHSGVGWREIFKNLLQLRLPVLSANNEFRAVQALTAIGVDTMTVAAYAESGSNPASRRSMIVTDDLVGTVSLEDFCAEWAQVPPAQSTRLRILCKLADSAGRMHRAGINHRDFYICHFHLDEQSLDETTLRCHLIDLHRAQIRRRTPRRWQEKDLAGLYFSALDCGLTRRDLLRFMSRYSEGGLHQAFGADRFLWQAVERKAARLYRREHGREPVLVRPGLAR
jgi:lipopolysaccharide core heptose(I) kinase